MPATAIVFTLATLTAQQLPPNKPYTEGQEVRVCGEVKTIRAAPPACDPTMRLASAAEEFDVVLPDIFRARIFSICRASSPIPTPSFAS